jgi:hypothetical protein
LSHWALVPNEFSVGVDVLARVTKGHPRIRRARSGS